MKTLVINAGSSSLKSALGNAKMHIDGIGLDSCKFTFSSTKKHIGQKISIKNHEEAVNFTLETFLKTKVIKNLKEIEAIGHRVVHGGEKFTEPAILTPPTIKALEKLTDLAPLHNPHNLEGIRICKRLFPKTKQIAVFDTAFHQTMPKKAFLYGLPYDWYRKHGIRKYGFHGTSHKYVTNRALKLLKKKKARIISCHLGNGSSITASLNGKCIDTSMGFTPLEGVIMGTRCGSIDPAIIFHAIEKLKMKPKEVKKILENESGLKGISGIGPDMREIYKQSTHNEKAKLAIEMLSYQIAKYIGSYAATLRGIDTIVFTGGLGEKAFYVRQKACRHLEFLGLKLDQKKNRANEETISDTKSTIKVFVIPTDEETQIATEVMELRLE